MATVLEARSLCKQFGAVTAASDISVAVEADSVVGLIGTNGAGKTTFVNMITGYLKPTSGTILFRDRDITQLPPRSITRLGVSRSFQIAQLFDTLTVADNMRVSLGIAQRNARAGWFGKTPREVPGFGAPPDEVAHLLLERFDLADWRDKPARQLPGGVRKLLDIALASVGQPSVLLLDEPTSGVSADEKYALMDRVMKAVRSEGVTVLFVEHDMEIVARYAHRVLAFYDGRIIADEAPEAALKDPEVVRYVIGGAAHHA
jgi:branched-chain amino acid transport system ATP-binding protein